MEQAFVAPQADEAGDHLSPGPGTHPANLTAVTTTRRSFDTERAYVTAQAQVPHRSALTVLRWYEPLVRVGALHVEEDPAIKAAALGPVAARLEFVVSTAA